MRLPTMLFTGTKLDTALTPRNDTHDTSRHVTLPTYGRSRLQDRARGRNIQVVTTAVGGRRPGREPGNHHEFVATAIDRSHKPPSPRRPLVPPWRQQLASHNIYVQRHLSYLLSRSRFLPTLLTENACDERYPTSTPCKPIGAWQTREYGRLTDS